MNKVRTGQKYRYQPVLLDRCDPRQTLQEGELVVVVKLPGCPRPGTMGHCHVNREDGSFGGLVCVNSLVRP